MKRKIYEVPLGVLMAAEPLGHKLVVVAHNSHHGRLVCWLNINIQL